jgi:hypothetical protein
MVPKRIDLNQDGASERKIAYAELQFGGTDGSGRQA